MGLLDTIFGGQSQSPHGGMSPITMALMGLLAYRTYQGKGKLAEMLNRTGPVGGAASSKAEGPGSGGLGGLLASLAGGAGVGGLLSGGLSDLLKQFQQSGSGPAAQSWISTGPNQPVAPDDVEKALGSERLDWLMSQTGLSREELLAGLSQQLPSFVDKLTPEGRIPSHAEATRMV